MSTSNFPDPVELPEGKIVYQDENGLIVGRHDDGGATLFTAYTWPESVEHAQQLVRVVIRLDRQGVAGIEYRLHPFDEDPEVVRASHDQEAALFVAMALAKAAADGSTFKL